MEKVTPICKYGHGAMPRQRGIWGMVGLRQMAPGENTRRQFLPSGDQFVCSMYRCPQCGYLELFDDEEAAT